MSTVDEIIGTDLAFKTDFLTTSTGDLATVTGLSNLQEALLRRLVTQPGSLIHRPEYGVGVKDFQNSVKSIANQQKLALIIKEQFELDPRVESVLGIQVITDDYKPNKIQFLIRVKPTGYDETQMSFIPFGDG